MELNDYSIETHLALSDVLLFIGDFNDAVKVLFAENSGLVFQSDQPLAVEAVLNNADIEFFKIGKAVAGEFVKVRNEGWNNDFHISQLRDIWYETSYLLDQRQSGVDQATLRFDNYKKQALNNTIVIYNNFSSLKIQA